MSCCGRREETGNRIIRANNVEHNRKAFVTNRISNTKYTLINFIPKRISEEFSRAQNQYFLLIAILQLFSELTPVNPLTTWLPLAVIFGVTAVKEAIDDLGRARADASANARKYTVIRNGVRQEIASRDIVAGEIIVLKANDEVPCDIVILSSSDPKGLGSCFIQTTNLDGESNLKVRSAISCTLNLTTDAAVGAWRGQIECAPPNEHIYKFDSQLKNNADNPNEQVQALSASQLLLQATHLRNTDWIIGMVVYTGNETKFGKNKKAPPTKFTRTDGFINNISATVFLLQLILVIIFGVIGDFWSDKNGTMAWYLQILPFDAAGQPGYGPLIIPLRFLLLNSTMIPISIKLTLDLCKLAYARFINADVHLFPTPENPVALPTAATPTPEKAANPMRGAGGKEAEDHSGEPPIVGAVSNSTALSEDLGQIKYVLSDKTGTLTENKMVLQVCTILGRQYGRFDHANNPSLNPPPVSAAASNTPIPHSLQSGAAGGIMADMEFYCNAVQEHRSGRRDACGLEFLRCLALNNDVVPSAPKGPSNLPPGISRIPVYKASSPDEEALVKAAAAYGVVLTEREGDDVTIEVLSPQHKEEYAQLACFEFNSDRKRMSVIVREKRTGMLRLYCKGADDMIMARLAGGQEEVKKRMQAQIDNYAEFGLRTLVFSYRDLTPQEYEKFDRDYAAASAAMVDRDGEKEKVYNSMERDLLLIGATAIEDKLQDCVPETIALLKKAGVAFWMLTGDKFSTALTIANTCNLKPKHNLLIEIDGESACEVKPSIDAAYTAVQKQGYDLAYEPLATGWAATASVLTLGFSGGRTQALLPHRPTSSNVGAGLSNSGSGSFDENSSLLTDTSGVHRGGGAAAMVSANPLQSASRSANGGGASVVDLTHVPGSARRDANTLRPFTVIVRGATLTPILADERLRIRFGAICLSADSVICCRVTPKQKGQLVKLVKDAGHMTLAIGDGGNDVAMIQEAAVGVGIRGKEGLQASRASDYSVPFFRSLQRLLLVHGRYSYYRTCLLAQYSFYKSFYFCIMQIVFGFFAGFSGVSLFNSLCVAAYNVVVFVPIVFFMTDRDISQATSLSLPEAYLMCNDGTMMTPGSMTIWMLRGLWQAIFTVLVGLIAGAFTLSSDYDSLGLCIYFAYSWVQDFTMLFSLRRANWTNFLSIFGMHALAFAVMLLANVIKPMQSLIDQGSMTAAVKDPYFWLLHLVVAVGCVFPVEGYKWFRLAFTRSFIGDLYDADARVERLLGPQKAASVGGAGFAWKDDVLKLSPNGGSLGDWIKNPGNNAGAGAAAGGKGGSGGGSGWGHLPGPASPTPLLDGSSITVHSPTGAPVVTVSRRSISGGSAGDNGFGFSSESSVGGAGATGGKDEETVYVNHSFERKKNGVGQATMDGEYYCYR
jgi:magnesium-transporting ATPase (P-type)